MVRACEQAMSDLSRERGDSPEATSAAEILEEVQQGWREISLVLGREIERTAPIYAPC